MRKIDSSAYNKRLHSELMELDKLLNRINPEHVNEIDSALIKTAFEYQALLGDSTWSNTSNFNGIEMSKVKQLIQYIKGRKKRLFIDREVVDISDDVNAAGSAFNSGVAAIGDKQIKGFPRGYDGRDSFVRAQIVGIRETEATDGIKYYNPVYFSDTDLIYDSNGIPSGHEARCGYVTTGSIRGNSSFLMAIKNANSIDISYKITKLGLWSDIATTRESDFVRLYLDVFYVLWR